MRHRRNRQPPVLRDDREGGRGWRLDGSRTPATRPGDLVVVLLNGGLVPHTLRPTGAVMTGPDVKFIWIHHFRGLLFAWDHAG